MNILKKKPIEKLIKDSYAGGEHHSMHRLLGKYNLVMLGVGAIVGAGIFVLTGQAAAQYAGPAITVSFIISAIACTFAALCYAEFASMIPVAGSAYTYAYATLGEFFAWIIGWDLVLEYLFAASMVAVGWSGYVVSALGDAGIMIPPEFCNAPLMEEASGAFKTTGAIFNFPAMLVVLLITGLLVLGVKESSRFNNIIVVIKVTVILLFISFGAFYMHRANLTPFLPENTGHFGNFGFSGVLRGAGIVFVAYIGFDIVSTAAQEAKNPQKDMPWGIIGSLIIATILYMCVAFVLTGMVNYQKLSVPHPIAVGIDEAGPALFWLRPIVKLGAIAGISSVLVALLYGQPRIFFSMARDGLLPPVFQKIHRRFRTPSFSTILTGLIAALIAGLFPIGILGDLVSIGTLLAFAIVCLGVLMLRYSQPDIPRPFKTPLVPVVPLLGAGFALLEMVSLPPGTWIRLIVWMLIGFVIYFTYGIKNSKLANGG